MSDDKVHLYPLFTLCTYNMLILYSIFSALWFEYHPSACALQTWSAQFP